MITKIRQPIWAISFLFLIACEQDSISSTTADQLITVSLNGESSMTYQIPDSLLAHYVVSDSIFIVSGMEHSLSYISVRFKGLAIGSYNVTWSQGKSDGSSNFDVIYVRSETEIYGAPSSGTVTVTSFGVVGEMVEGTYNAVVSVSTDSPLSSEQAQISGSFSVVRKADFHPPSKLNFHALGRVVSGGR